MALCLLLLMAVRLLAPAGAHAQIPPLPAVSPPASGAADAGADGAGDLAALLRTLEDPAARERLIAQLQLLQRSGEAKPAQPVAEAPQDLVAATIAQVSDRAETATNTLLSFSAALEQIPALFRWLGNEVSNEYSRTFYLNVLHALVIAFGIGAALGIAGHIVPRRFRHRLRVPPDADLVRRLLIVLARLAVELVPPVLFVTASIIGLRFAGVSGLIQLLATELLLALALGRTLAAVRRTFLYPLTGEGRPLPIDDDTAREANRWSSLIGSIAIYGTFSLRAAELLGMPSGVHDVLLHLLFLAITSMLVALVWRLRAPVAAGFASLNDSWGKGKVGSFVPWEWLIARWHIVASAWIVIHYIVWSLHVPGGFRFLFRATLATFLVLVAARCCLVLIGRWQRKPQPETTEDELPHEPTPAELSRWRMLKTAEITVWTGTLLLLLEAWNISVIEWLQGSTGRASLVLLLRIGLILGLTFLIWAGINRWLGGYITAQDPQGNLVHSRRTRTLANIGRNLVLVLLLLFVVLFVLTEIGIDTGPLLAGAGVVGIAVGFGSQKLVQDIITGLFILLGDTIRVGDVVSLGGRAGAVEAMTMRTVTLRDYSGAVITIPYSTIDVVTNMTKDFSFAVFNVNVSFREDVDQVMQVLRDLDTQLRREWPYRRLILEPLDIAGVDRLGDSAVTIMARTKTRPGDQWKVVREMNRRIKLRFEELGIEIPFPHQTIYFGAGKDGSAPPLHIEAMRSAGAAVQLQDRPVRAVGEA